MKKLLGKIEVYVDTEEKEEPSTVEIHNDEMLDGFPVKFTVTINPNSDQKYVARDLENLTDKEKLQTSICHELGHVVSVMTRERCQLPQYTILNSSLDSEKKAWDNASKMHCYIDPTIRRRCLESYVREKQEFEDELSQHPFLQRMREIARRKSGMFPEGQEPEVKQ